MTPLEVIFAAASLALQAAAVGVIWSGVWQMRRTGDQRAAREDARHAEAMTRLDQQGEALRVLIERTGGRG